MLIFCDWIEQGQALADQLDIPFIHGSTPRKLEKVQESEICVVSRIGNRGISLPDLRLVIEVAGAGSAREQFAQRVGRLLHGEFEGEFITVFTPEEAAKYRGRIFGVEAELAGEVDIEFIAVGKVQEIRSRSQRIMKPNRTSLRPGNVKQEKVPKTIKERDEIAQILDLPTIAAKITQAQKSVGDSTAPYIKRVIRYCWTAPLSARELAEGLGVIGSAAKSRLQSACKASAKMDLCPSMTTVVIERTRLRSIVCVH